MPLHQDAWHAGQPTHTHGSPGLKTERTRRCTTRLERENNSNSHARCLSPLTRPVVRDQMFQRKHDFSKGVTQAGQSSESTTGTPLSFLIAGSDRKAGTPTPSRNQVITQSRLLKNQSYVRPNIAPSGIAQPKQPRQTLSTYNTLQKSSTDLKPTIGLQSVN